jgi:hypothetical protein
METAGVEDHALYAIMVGIVAIAIAVFIGVFTIKVNR